MIKPAFPDGHFYSPIVDPDQLIALKDTLWSDQKITLGIDHNHEGQKEFLLKQFPQFIDKFDYPELLSPTDEKYKLYINNSQFSWLDCRTHYVMLRSLRPKNIIEIGSGYSSLLTADVNRRFFNEDIRFTCIEPYPRDFLVFGVPGIANLIINKVQNVNLEIFKALNEKDILFIDSSHVSKTGSDVNFIFFEILPRLNKKVVIHFHDIFLPNEYPLVWVMQEGRSWNEQYLLQALLLYSSKFKVIFGCNYAAHYLKDVLYKVMGGHVMGGGSFWIEKQ